MMKDWMSNHPNITMWIVLAVGMVIIVAFSARDVGLVASQWFWLVVLTVLVAGACIRIISWDDGDETE